MTSEQRDRLDAFLVSVEGTSVCAALAAALADLDEAHAAHERHRFVIAQLVERVQQLQTDLDACRSVTTDDELHDLASRLATELFRRQGLTFPNGFEFEGFDLELQTERTEDELRYQVFPGYEKRANDLHLGEIVAKVRLDLLASSRAGLIVWEEGTT